jgi:hypothetical protein
MKVIYTESARNELDRFYQEQRERLEEVVRKRKFVFGDDQLEITASDIKEAVQAFTVRDRSSYSLRRLHFASVLLRVYAVAGILLALGGIFYPYFVDLYRDNPPQFALVIAGVGTTLFSVLMMYVMRQRADRYRRMAELEEMRFHSSHSLDELDELQERIRGLQLDAEIELLNSTTLKEKKSNKALKPKEGNV